MKRKHQLVACLISLFLCNVCSASLGEGGGVLTINPSASNTGNRIAFASDFESPGIFRIWTMALDGTQIERIQTSPYSRNDEEPSLSPDGQTIAFASSNGTTTDIWTVSSDGSRLIQLTRNAVNNRQPAWSPDGRKIAFVSDRGGSNDIWSMNHDGTAVQRLTQLPGQENHPSFSPDGNSIVFSSLHDGPSVLMTINSDGTNLKQITSGNYSDRSPSWGKGGILFSSRRDTPPNHWKIWLIQSDGSGLRKVRDTIALDATWMSDGKIVFTDETSSAAATAVISVLNPVTGSKTQTTPPSFFGDLNGDGIVDLIDLSIIQKSINTNTTIKFDARDRNRDGHIDALDLRILKNICTYDRCTSRP